MVGVPFMANDTSDTGGVVKVPKVVKGEAASTKEVKVPSPGVLKSALELPFRAANHTAPPKLKNPVLEEDAGPGFTSSTVRPVPVAITTSLPTPGTSAVMYRLAPLRKKSLGALPEGPGCKSVSRGAAPVPAPRFSATGSLPDVPLVAPQYSQPLPGA